MHLPSLLFFLHPLEDDKSIYPDRQKGDRGFAVLVFSHNVAIACQSCPGSFSAHRLCLYAIATGPGEHCDTAEEPLFCSFTSSSVCLLHH